MKHFEALLTGLLWLPQSKIATNLQFYGALYQRYSGELSSCYDWGSGRFQLGPCITVSLEDVGASARGPGVVAGGHGETRWVTVGFGPRGRWSPRPWTAVFVRPTVVFNTARPRFDIDMVGSAYQVGIAAVGISVGCEWIL